MKNNDNSAWTYTKCICLLGTAGCFLYKFIISDFKLITNFNELLSLILALFSIALASAFYFKATDTSSQFYDNIYKFTKDIAELLVRIESGFGERLLHIDKTQSNIHDKLYGKENKEIEDTEAKIEEKKESIENIIKEKDTIISELIEKSKIDKEEKEKFRIALDENEKKYVAAKDEITLLRNKVDIAQSEMSSEDEQHIVIKRRVTRYVRSQFIEKIDDISESPRSTVAGLFSDFVDNSLPNFKSDIEYLGYYANDKLTFSGLKFIQMLIANHKAPSRLSKRNGY